jgi:pyruvate kinase
VAAVRTISEIALDVQKHFTKTNPEGVDIAVSDVNTFLAKAAVDAALALNASAIVVPSLTGTTARLIASLRSHKPIYAPCYSDSVMRQLAMSHGIRAGRLKHYESAEELIYNCAKYLLEKDELPPHSLVVVVAGTPSPHLHRSDLLKVATLQTIIGEYEQR